ncbi:YdcF family protein [Thalassorhabdomicrobium marinisediminis]|uniref:YdcF family protein n=1 Tax=Thalassorhabdomicrobium marinisediminis TaxID=2170577 RepID=UPI0024913CDE|nr:YdcF family protein [Thalassorhabdomicrobium marinisediminis]
MTTGLILGAAVWATGPSPTLARRTRHGAQLYHAGAVQRLIVCGGLGRHPPSEAHVMAALLEAEGVPASAVVLEDRSTTTRENIRFALPLLDEADVIVITDWSHAPRARLIARRHGLRARSSSPSLKGARIWPQTKMAGREVFAYLAHAFHIVR